MTTRSNDATGQSHGTAATTGNTGGASGDAFNAITLGSTSTVTFDNTEVPDPDCQSYRFNLVTTSSITDVRWTGLNSTTFSIRFFINFVVVPVADFYIFAPYDNQGTPVRVGALHIQGTSKLRLTSAAGTTLWTSAAALSADTQYRIELGVAKGTTTSNGTLRVAYFLGHNPTPIEAQYDNTATNTGILNLTQARYGKIFSGTNGNDIFISRFHLDDTTDALLGPPLHAVESTRATTWATAGNVVDPNGATTWATRANVAATTRATTWDVAAPFVTVASTRATTWAAHATVAATTRATTYAARATVTPATRATTYATLADVTDSTRATTWDTLAAVLSVNLAAANPTFETATTGWSTAAGTSASATITRQASGGPTGDTYGRWTWTATQTNVGSAGGAYLSGGGASYLPAAPGDYTSVRVTVRTSVAQRMTVYMQYLDATTGGTTVLSTIDTPVVTVAGEWTGLVFHATQAAPSGTVRCRVLVYSASGTGGVSWQTGDTLDVANLMVARGTATGPYYAAIGPVAADTAWETDQAVATTRATTWDTDGVVVSTRASTWATKGAIAVARASTWDVASSLVTVSSSRATTWASYGQATATRASTWTTIGTVVSTRATTYAARATVAPSTRATSYATRGVASGSRSTLWTALARITGTRATTHAARATVATSTRSTTWSAKDTVEATRSTTWETDSTQVTVTNSFENGTVGTDVLVSNSGGASGTAFDIVLPAGGGGYGTYDDAWAAHGTKSAKLAISTANGVHWNFSTSVGTLGEHYGRAYVRWPANPLSTHVLYRAMNSTAVQARVTITTGGLVRLDNASSLQVAISTTSITSSAGCRIEWHIVHHATAGSIQVRIYTSLYSSTIAETVTATNINTGTQATLHNFGSMGSNAIGTCWVDEVGVTNAGWLGVSTTTLPVVSTRSTSWTNRAAVVDAVPTTWAARALVVGVARSTSWPVRIVVPASTRATSWKLDGRISTTRATSWRALASLRVPEPDAGYDDTYEDSYGFAIGSTGWAVRQRITVTRPTVWYTDALIQPVEPSTRSTGWSLQGRVISTRATTWAARTRVTDTSGVASWTVRTPVTPTARATSWTTRIPVPASLRATTWETRLRIAGVAVRSTTWADLAARSSTRATLWAAKQARTSQRATLWTTQAVAPPWVRSRTTVEIHTAPDNRVEVDPGPGLLVSVVAPGDDTVTVLPGNQTVEVL